MATVYKQNSVTNIQAFQWLGGTSLSSVPFWAQRAITHVSNGSLQVQGRLGVNACAPKDWVILNQDGSIGIESPAAFAVLYQVGP